MGQNWGKRSIGLDVREPADRAVLLALARQADVIVENQLAGFWAEKGIDFAALRAERPALIVCSVTGFGQTGAVGFASLPRAEHGRPRRHPELEWEDGQPHRGWTFTSWGNELGTAFAAMAILAALVSVRTTGQGAWIDLSCWDALVESHRTEIAMTRRTKQPFSMHARCVRPSTTPTCPVTGSRCCWAPRAEILEAVLREDRARRSDRPPQRPSARFRR